MYSYELAQFSFSVRTERTGLMIATLVVLGAIANAVQGSPCYDLKNLEQCKQQVLQQDDILKDLEAAGSGNVTLLHNSTRSLPLSINEPPLPAMKEEISYVYAEPREVKVGLTGPTGLTEEEERMTEIDIDYKDREDHVTQHLKDFNVNTDMEITCLQATDVEDENNLKMNSAENSPNGLIREVRSLDEEFASYDDYDDDSHK